MPYPVSSQNIQALAPLQPPHPKAPGYDVGTVRGAHTDDDDADANSLDDDDDSSVQSEDFYSFISYEVCNPLAYTLMRMSYSLRTVNRTQIRRFPAASCR